MPSKSEIESLIKELDDSCCCFWEECRCEIEDNVSGQHPNMAVLCCADSRVPPELIFNKTVGELFVVRVAGNVAVDTSVLFSLEYAVEHLGVEYLIVLGHTYCGAVAASEEAEGETDNHIVKEICCSFPMHEDHCVSNVMRQLKMLPERSEKIKDAVEKNRLALIGALYHIEDGTIEFLD